LKLPLQAYPLRAEVAAELQLPIQGVSFSDTADGTLSKDASNNYAFEGNAISAVLSVPGSVTGIGFITWNAADPTAFFGVVSNSGYFHVSVQYQRFGYTQFGTCPSHCSFLSVSSVTVHDEALAVPAPSVGSFSIAAALRLFGVTR